MVFSNWDGERCIAATPVRVDDLGEVAELVVSAVVRSPGSDMAPWPAPNAADVIAVVPAKTA